MAKRKMRVGEIRRTKNKRCYKKFKNGKVKFITCPTRKKR